MIVGKKTRSKKLQKLDIWGFLTLTSLLSTSACPADASSQKLLWWGVVFFWSSNKSTNQVQIRRLLTHGIPERSLCFLSQKYYSWKEGNKDPCQPQPWKVHKLSEFSYFPTAQKNYKGGQNVPNNQTPHPHNSPLKEVLKDKGWRVTCLTKLSAAAKSFKEKLINCLFFN